MLQVSFSNNHKCIQDKISKKHKRWYPKSAYTKYNIKLYRAQKTEKLINNQKKKVEILRIPVATNLSLSLGFSVFLYF